MLQKTLESPLDSEESKPVNPKGNQPCIFVAEAPILGHLMGRSDLLENILLLGKTEGRRRRGQQRMRWLDGITDVMDMTLSKLQTMVTDRGACHSPVHGVAKNGARVSN